MGISWKAAPTAEEQLQDAKQARMSVLNATASEQLEFIRSAYPQFEVDTWNDQRAEALAYTDDSGADTPMLSGIAKARGLDLGELVQRVLNKVDHYRDAVSEVTGKRQWCEDRVFEAETVEAVNAVEWPE